MLKNCTSHEGYLSQYPILHILSAGQKQSICSMLSRSSKLDILAYNAGYRFTGTNVHCFLLSREGRYFDMFGLILYPE